MTAAIFDLDGTLVDSAPDIHSVANAVLAEHGHGAITLAQTVAFIGNGSEVFVTRMMQAVGLPAQSPLFSQLHDAFLDRYERTFELSRPFPGVEDQLRTLGAAGWRLGLCTNKPAAPTQALLDHLDLAQHFEAIICGDTLRVRKPDPAPLRHTAAALGAGRAVYVGDSEVDSRTARAAAIPFALFTRGYRNAPVADIAHDVAFEDFGTLKPLLERLFDAQSGDRLYS